MLMQQFDKRILFTTEPSKVIHIDRPCHRTEVPLLLDPVHLYLHTLGVFVSDPLGSFVGVRALAMVIPLLTPF